MSEFTPEKTELRIGVIPLVDAAPIVSALHLGLFERYGLDVTVSVEGAWASIRDKVAAGVLDAAHMLAPMPIAATLGIDGVGVPMLTALSLNLNGNAITVSDALFGRMQVDGLDPVQAGQALKRVLDADREAGAPPCVLAHVFPFSAHHYELRYWLAGSGIDPDHDLRLTVIPPPQMVEQMTQGRIDGFCVGAPWGGVAEARGVGRSIVNTHQIWHHSPEKVLGVTREWADAHPQTHLAMISALLQASRWLDEDTGHRHQAADWLVASAGLQAPIEVIREALTPHPDGDPRGPGLVFHQGGASFPWGSHALWFMGQMRRWGQYHGDPAQDLSLAKASYRSDLFRVAARHCGIAAPAQDSKREGLHAASWQSPAEDGSNMRIGSDLFFDGARFEP